MTPPTLKIQPMELEDDGAKCTVCKGGSVCLVGNTEQWMLMWHCSLRWRKDTEASTLLPSVMRG